MALRPSRLRRLAQTMVGPDGIRMVRYRGSYAYCVRTTLLSNTPRRSGRYLLVVVSPRGMDAQVMDQVLRIFNETYGGSPDGPDDLANILGQTLAARIPGSAAYYVRLPAR